MARTVIGSHRQTGVQFSLLDRLREKSSAGTIGSSSGDIATLKQLLAQDLEMLLNSRRTLDDDLLAAYPHAARSLLSFGVPDLSTLSLLDPADRDYLQTAIRNTIQLFENRLRTVRVMLETNDSSERSLRFRVDAVLEIHPATPLVSFDAVLHVQSQRYSVRGLAA